MKVLVTGGTGFIGNYVIRELLERRIEVVVFGRDSEKAKSFGWYDKVTFVEIDIEQDNRIITKIPILGSIGSMIHLAWNGLPNYNELFHFETNLMNQFTFIKEVLKSGIRDITISGTCLEYGLKEGCLDPTMDTDPVNPYALAKDTLRKFLQELQKKESFNLKWMRLFYMYGEGQSKNSILSQLDLAISEGLKVFNMSGGEQLRDYLPVEEVAKIIVNFNQRGDLNGIFNCCSGTPISIKKLVENHLIKINKTISLNLGYYAYPDYEPMQFWGKKFIV